MSIAEQTTSKTIMARIEAMLCPRPDGKPWPKLSSYQDQPTCVCCGRDETGLMWPLCADLVKGCPTEIRDEAHFLLCIRMAHHDWMCDSCKQPIGGVLS